MSNRFEVCFAQLEAKNEGAFMPFVTLCDPDFETSLEILKTLMANGADALELGFPFSDPCADGPVIQNADKRALNSGANTSDFLRLIAAVRAMNPTIPMSCLVYANVVYARGIDQFFADAARAGLDAVLIPDVPVGMLRTQGDFESAAERHGVCTVLIAPPNASDEALKVIARRTRGYTYVLSRFGITGTEVANGKPTRVVQTLKACGAPQSIIGFGISKPEHVRAALETGAIGAIAGSACVRIIENHLGDREAMLSELAAYVREMKAATLPLK